jgi:uncharacterized protein (DUF58 family)
VTDPREDDWPAAGLVRVEDAETGRQVLLDTSNAGFRRAFAARAADRRERFRKLARGCGVDVIEAGTDGRHFDALTAFFRMRDRRRGGRT